MVLIDATVCQILLKQKCDGRTDGQTDGGTEGIPIVPLFDPQMAGDKNTCVVTVITGGSGIAQLVKHSL